MKKVKKVIKLEIDSEVKPVWNAEWFEEDGLVKIKIPKFMGKVGKWLCNTLKKPDYFTVDLDEIGSLVWKKCDGEKNVGMILKEIKESMGERFEKEDMKKRCYLFLHVLQRRGLIKW